MHQDVLGRLCMSVPTTGWEVLVIHSYDSFILVSSMPGIQPPAEVQEMVTVQSVYIEVKENKLRKNQLHFSHLSTVPVVIFHFLKFSWIIRFQIREKPYQMNEMEETTKKKNRNRERLWERHRHNKTEKKTRVSLSRSGGVGWRLPQAPGSKDKDPIAVSMKLNPLHTTTNFIFTAWTDLPNFYCWDYLRR